MERERVLSIEQVAEQTPWSTSTLYREAKKPDSPFRKQAGRWVTTESDLLEWVRSGEKPQPRSSISADPMAPRRMRGSLRSKVIELDARRKAA